MIGFLSRFLRVLPVLAGSCWLVILPVFGQSARISGTVQTAGGEALPGANVLLSGTILGASTEDHGRFVIEHVPPGDYTLSVTVIGYVPWSKAISPGRGQLLEMGIIRLTTSAVAGQPVVVTAGKYEQRVQDVPASLATIDEKELQYRNTVTVDKALQYVSGVNINGGQINIRGSSGYSRGVGSRVLMLLDGVPFLTGDTRDIVYETIPTYLIERVEVVKGAGSALYGSSALGGVVNVITRGIGTTPRATARTYGGVYASPSFDAWKWTSENRYFNGQSFSYSRPLGKFGFQLGGTRDEDDSYKQNGWRKRWTGSGKLDWRISPFQQLTVSGNYMYQKRGEFLYWQDLNHALQPPGDQLDDVVKTNRYYLSTHYRNILSPHTYLIFRGIWYWNRFGDTVSEGGGNRSTAQNISGEVQLTTQAGAAVITAGVEGNLNRVDANIFGKRDGVGAAGYLQTEFPVSEKIKLTLGARLDLSDIDSLRSDTRVNPKFGVVFKPQPGTALRAAVGLGFRAPSIAEAFTSTSASGLLVIPNSRLKSERSYYGEVGWNQIYGNTITSDVTFYYSRFSDLIEGNFGAFLPGVSSLVIQFQNITRARVMGAEASLAGRTWNERLHYSVGYTFVDSRDLQRDDFLNFRPRHLLYSGVQLTLPPLNIGVDHRYISRYDRIDERFALIVPDAQERVSVYVTDLRLSVDFKLATLPANASFQINNLFNYYYVDLVGALAQLRNYVVTLQAGL